MTATPADVKFEIGHVLFLDIVGYSKLLISEQTAQLEMLRTIVRGTEQVRAAEAEGKLLRLPTGDGGALVFRTSPDAEALWLGRATDEHSAPALGFIFHPEFRRFQSDPRFATLLGRLGIDPAQVLSRQNKQ